MQMWAGTDYITSWLWQRTPDEILEVFTDDEFNQEKIYNLRNWRFVTNLQVVIKTEACQRA